MTTIHEARFRVARRLLELGAGGEPPRIDQIDAVLANDGRQVFFYAYLVDDTLMDGAPLLATVDLPARLTEATFDPAAFV
jgi:hypothetical protein